MASSQGSAAQAGQDRVIPLHYFDDSPMFSRITMYVLMVFDEVLDPEKLRSSLDGLVRRETWQKLGARVRKGAKGLEYHVPQQYSAERPAISYVHVAQDMLRSEHPVAAKLPTAASIPVRRPATVGNPEEWAELACGADSPKALEDYTLTDRPVLGLRIVSFKDSTLVTIHWLHVAADAMGLRAIVDSWALMLQGRGDEVMSLHGFDKDPLRELGMHPTETFELAGSVLGPLATGSYVLRNGYRLLVGKKENRTVCIPPAFWQKMREDCLQELRDAGDPNPFLTENDVLTAWWSRLAVCHLPANKPVTIMQAMSARKALAGDLLPPDRLYVGNCLSFKNLLRTKKEMDASLGRLAGDIRKAVNTQGTRAQIEAYEAMVRAKAWPLGPLPIFFGKANMHHMGYSNWFKSGVYMADFSAAAVRKLDAPLTPSFVSQIQTGLPYPEGFIITGKDAKGNYWLEGYRPAGLWEKIEKELAAGTK